MPVSTHSHPKAAGKTAATASTGSRFQHTAARRRLGRRQLPLRPAQGFNTQPPEGSWANCNKPIPPKTGFNTQPPEGGWESHQTNSTSRHRFNTQPPEGGWRLQEHTDLNDLVSTHSRPKAAGCFNPEFFEVFECFNTQPPEGGWLGQWLGLVLFGDVSTHSRPKAAGAGVLSYAHAYAVSTHSRPKAAGQRSYQTVKQFSFQHTAARRRLDGYR